MSEFECRCGELMVHGVCPSCGSHRAYMMDGLTRLEWRAKEKYEAENYEEQEEEVEE